MYPCARSVSSVHPAAISASYVWPPAAGSITLEGDAIVGEGGTGGEAAGIVPPGAAAGAMLAGAEPGIAAGGVGPAAGAPGAM